MRRILLVTAILFFVVSCSQRSKSGNESKSAKQLYSTHCAICHGDDGKKGLAGAKLLPESELDLKQRIAIITEGKGQMMPYEGVLSTKEIELIANYTLSLK